MSAGRRLLQLASHAAVILWLGAYFAWPQAQALPEPEPERTARVEPRAEPPAPEPETAKPQTPPAAEEPPARAQRVSAAEISEGGRLLDGAGVFPALSSSYEDFPSFGAYARAMARLGALFVIVRDREIVGRIDPVSGAIGDATLARAFSPRARDYTGEPGLAPLARAARERFGSGAEVMMLVPREVDAGLFGAISGALSRRGEAHDGLREIRARYERGPGGGVRLRVDAAVRRDGSEVEMDLLFDLTDIARTGSAGGPAA